MSDNFFKINRGLLLDPQETYGIGDPAGSNGDIYYNKITEKFRKHENGTWSDLGGGGGSGSGNGWVAYSVPISISSTSKSVVFTNPQTDTSYVIFAVLENTIDPFPQFQEVAVTSKTTLGFTATWNYGLDSANYNLVYIVPPKILTTAEDSLGNSVSTFVKNYLLPQSSSTYPLLVTLQNLVDPSPQFQPTVITAKTTTTSTIKMNSPTDSANYKSVWAIAGTGQVAIGSGTTSAIGTLPVNYGTSSYAVIGMIYDSTDPFPQFQTVLVTVRNSDNFTASWNAPTDSSNYVLVYYALSLAP